MKALWTTLAIFVPALCILPATTGQAATSNVDTSFQWFAFPDSAKFKVLGLYWFDQNDRKLWRVPAKDIDSLPKGVQGRCKCPSGARITMRCTTTRLAIQAVAVNGGGLRKFDTYVNGQPCKPAVAERASNETELVLFEDLDNQEKEIVIYLPHLQEVVVKAIGVDPQTRLCAPEYH